MSKKKQIDRGAFEKLRDVVLENEKQGKVVITALEGDFYAADLGGILDQPTEGLLWDLNRSAEVVLAYIEDIKWVNDYACMQVITKLHAERDAQAERMRDAEQRVKQYRLYADAIATILEPIRQKRETGEPARSDREEIIAIIERGWELERENDRAAAVVDSYGEEYAKLERERDAALHTLAIIAEKTSDGPAQILALAQIGTCDKPFVELDDDGHVKALAAPEPTMKTQDNNARLRAELEVQVADNKNVWADYNKLVNDLNELLPRECGIDILDAIKNLRALLGKKRKNLVSVLRTINRRIKKKGEIAALSNTDFVYALRNVLVYEVNEITAELGEK